MTVPVKAFALAPHWTELPAMEIESLAIHSVSSPQKVFKTIRIL